MRIVLPLALMLALSSCPTSPTEPEPAVMFAVGDIAACDSGGDETTANLMDTLIANHPDAPIALLGDLAYNTGSSAEFNNCYAPSWGRFKSRSRPAVGNHEYETLNAAPYYAYFGANAGDPSKGYYSYEAGAWHVVVLNSNCAVIGGCEAGSAQEQWLRADLSAHPVRCTLAYWHHPLFSSGIHGNNVFTHDLWQALMDANADLVLVGHDHHYERFAPQDANGTLDAIKGIREIIVGTGGKTLRPVTQTIPNSEASNSATLGVLKLNLFADRYDWRFVPEPGASFTDSGTTNCH
jgi:acid phosphatase type 7